VQIAVRNMMMRRLMVPLDGTPFAEQALPWATALARAARGAVHVVHVRPSLPLLPESATEEYMHSVQQSLELALAGRITSALITYQPGALLPAIPAADGVAHALLDYAREQDISAIIMTTHGRGGLRHAWLGSVAVNVLRNCRRPVFIVRPNSDAGSNAALADRAINHIIVPLDGSDVALTALPFAYQLGKPFGAHYTLVSLATPVPWSLGIDADVHAPIAFPEYDRADARRELESAAAQLRVRGADAKVALLEEWPPDTAILNYAASCGVDAIVLATSARQAFGRLLTTSVADRLIRASAVPVLCCDGGAGDAAGARDEAAEIAQAYIPLS
jgi:nucleotide-binding universal stress UspA family protein